MIHKSAGEIGTILDPDAWAGIWSPREGFVMYTPKVGDEDAPMALGARALMGVIIRLHDDPEFVSECAAWLEEKTKT